MKKAEQITDWVMSHASVEKNYKEEWDAVRFMLGGKMFGMLACNKENTPILTLKLPPQEGAFYRENFPFITPGYYMNKVHWISIAYEEAENSLLQDIIAKAYEAFLASLPKKVRIEITDKQ